MPAEPQTGISVLPLVGRRRELDALAAGHEVALAGRATVVLIAGETGAGKSRLVREFVTGLGDHASLVLTGTSPVIVGSDIPFAPIAGALRELSQRVSRQRLLELIPPESELARLLPEHSAGRNGPDPLAQVRLFEQWLSLLVCLGAEHDGGIVLILEDLQWSDASTRDLVAYLVSNLSTGHVLVLLTVRSEALAGNASLRRLLFEATRQPTVRSIDIDPLTREETEAVVTTVGGAGLSPRARMRIVDISGGNPLFAEQLVQAGDDEGLPHSLVELVRERLDQLSPPARRMAQLASAVGTGLPLAMLEEAATKLQLNAAPALTELREAGIVALRIGPPTDSYVFRHPLTQEVVYGELMPAERAALHRILGDIMARPSGDRPADSAWVLELARHLWLGGDRVRAIPALVSAGDSAMESFAFSEALILYERAIEPGVSETSPKLGQPIGVRANGTSAARGGELRSVVERAAQAASLSGNPERALELLDGEHGLGQGGPTVSMRRAEYLWQAGRQAAALDIYKSALAISVPSEGRAALQGAAARAMLLAGQTHNAQRLASEAVESARAAGAESEELHALYTLSAAHARLGGLQTGLETLGQARELDLRRQRRTRLQPRPSRIVDLLSGYWSEAAVLGSAGRTEEAAAAALEGAQTAARLGIRGGWGGMVGVAAAEELIALGRWSEAEALLEEWLNTSAPPSDAAHTLAVYAFLLALQGHMAQASRHLGTSQQQVRAPSDTRLHFAQLRAEAEIGLSTGQAGGVGRSLGSGLQDLGDRVEPNELAELLAMSLHASAERADQARARGAKAELAAIQSDAVVLHCRVLANAEARAPSEPRLRALLAWATAEYGRVMGDRDAAPWLAAGEHWAALREPHRVAYVQLRAAEDQLARRGGRQEARRLLADAQATCLELGAEPLRREVESLARRARLEMAPSEPKSVDRTATGEDPNAGSPFGLSPREIEVVELLADGRTNRQIGDVLFITAKSASHHVSSILGKLGVTSRVEAASMAASAGIGMTYTSGIPIGGATGMLRDADLGESQEVTMMFTDIVSSTALLEAIGDSAWLELIGWHDELLRSLVRAYSGREVDHAGDGFFLVFPDVIAALDCGVTIQRSLAEHRRKHGFAPRLRVAVHRARVMSEGAALRGKGVHQAARIAEAACGDEIVISSESLEFVPKRYARGEQRTVTGAGLAQAIPAVLIEWRQVANR
ncbi:MAG: AAA family ATPase [Candidatus Limnocylindria bacterium]